MSPRGSFVALQPLFVWPSTWQWMSALLGPAIHMFADATDWAHGRGILVWNSRAWVADRQHFDNFHAPWCVHGHFVATAGSCLDQRRGDWGCQADLALSDVGFVHTHNCYCTLAFRATDIGHGCTKEDAITV